MRLAVDWTRLPIPTGLRSVVAVAAAMLLPATTVRGQSPSSESGPAAAASLPPAIAAASSAAPIESPIANVLPSADDSRPRMNIYWDDKLIAESADRQFRLHVGGTIQIDSTWLIGPNGLFLVPGDGTSGVGNSAAVFLRRGRFQLDGTVWGQFDFVIDYDLANAANDANNGADPPQFDSLLGSPAPKDVWIQARDVPWLGTVRFGNQKKPIGMINIMHQNSLPFMERPDNSDAFYAPFDSGRALGVSSKHVAESERATWEFGVYRPSENVFGVALNKFEWGSRATALPLYEDDGKALIHVGFGTLNGEIPQNDLRARARPLLRNGPGFAVPVLVDTGNIPGSRQYTIAPEFAAAYGSWSFQAEWAGQALTHATINGVDIGTVFYQGGYAEILYVLTGEQVPYVKDEGVFGRIAPKSNFRVSSSRGCSGSGAWQIGTRFGYVDLNDKAIQGGTLYDWTAGVNWIWNPNMRVQLNYILEYRDQPGVPAGWINGIGIRTVCDF